MNLKSGAALILLAGLIWSSQGVLLRQISLAEPWAIMAWRAVGLVATLALYVSYRTKGQLWGPITSVGRSGFLGACALVVAFGGAIYALQTTTIASAVVLFAAAPFFAALIGWAALGERVAPATWAAIVAAIIGIAVMVGGEIDLRAIWGNIAALICALGFGAFTVSLRASHGALRADVGHFPIVLLAGIIAIFVGTALALMTGQDLSPPARDIGISLFMGVFTLAFGMILFTQGTRTVTAAAATLLAQIEVILGPFWVWLFMGEAFSRATAIGGAIVLGALVFNVWANERGSRPLQSPAKAH
jgi:drug/metabolite transporter, DME family